MSIVQRSLHSLVWLTNWPFSTAQFWLITQYHHEPLNTYVQNQMKHAKSYQNPLIICFKADMVPALPRISIVIRASGLWNNTVSRIDTHKPICKYLLWVYSWVYSEGIQDCLHVKC